MKEALRGTRRLASGARFRPTVALFKQLRLRVGRDPALSVACGFWLRLDAAVRSAFPARLLTFTPLLWMKRQGPPEPGAAEWAPPPTMGLGMMAHQSRRCGLSDGKMRPA